MYVCIYTESIYMFQPMSNVNFSLVYNRTKYDVILQLHQNLPPCNFLATVISTRATPDSTSGHNVARGPRVGQPCSITSTVITTMYFMTAYDATALAFCNLIVG